MAKASGGALAKSVKNLPVDWEAQMANLAGAYKSAEANTGGGAFLSIRAGVLSFDGAPVPGNNIDAVVLEAIHENAYYAEDFDADNLKPPVCFAYSDSRDTLKPGEDAALLETRMKPHPDSSEPQHETCKGCPQNEFWTADKGKGKACKNIRKLVLLHSDYLKKPDSIEAAPLIQLKVPVTSCGGWAGHVKKIANVLEKPPFAVVTNIAVFPDPKKQVVVKFDVKSEIPKAILGPVFLRHKEGYALLTVPYQADSGEKGGSGKRPASKKKAAGKPAGKPAAGAQAKRKKF